MRKKEKHYYVFEAYHRFIAGPDDLCLTEKGCETYAEAEAFLKKNCYDPECRYSILYYQNKCWWRVEYDRDLEGYAWTHTTKEDY